MNESHHLATQIRLWLESTHRRFFQHGNTFHLTFGGSNVVQTVWIRVRPQLGLIRFASCGGIVVPPSMRAQAAEWVVRANNRVPAMGRWDLALDDGEILFKTAIPCNESLDRDLAEFHLSLVLWAGEKFTRSLMEVVVGKSTPAEAIRAIEFGRSDAMSMESVPEIDPPFTALMEQLFAGLSDIDPALEAHSPTLEESGACHQESASPRRVRGRPPIPEATRSRVRRMAAEGFPAKRIASKTGVSLSSVYKILNLEPS